MEWILPGTVLSADIAASGAVAQQFKSMFMGGGIMLSQVSAITGLEHLYYYFFYVAIC